MDVIVGKIFFVIMIVSIWKIKNGVEIAINEIVEK